MNAGEPEIVLLRWTVLRGVWIPNNEILKRDGVTDTPEAARTYLHGIIGDVVEPERIDTYLQRAPEMLSFVLKHTPLKMTWVPGYSDYYPEAPGGRPGGRSIEPKPFNARRLGEDLAGLEPPYSEVPLNVVVLQQDYVRLNLLKRHPKGLLRSLRVGTRTMWAKATGRNLVGMGRALIARLCIGLRQAGGPRPAEHRAHRPVCRRRRGPRRLCARYDGHRNPLSRN
jgi:3-oxosteroid 1-dehydrogenase